MINTTNIEEAKRLMKKEEIPKIILAQNDEFNRKLGEKMEEYIETKKFKEISDLFVGIQNEAGDKALKGINKAPITRKGGEQDMEK